MVILGHKLKLFVRDGKKMTKMIDKLKLPADKKEQITIKETDIFKPENLDLTGKIHIIVELLQRNQNSNSN